MTQKFAVSFPDGLFDALEQARGDVPRSVWLQRLVEAAPELGGHFVEGAEVDPPTPPAHPLGGKGVREAPRAALPREIGPDGRVVASRG